ncbi:MAG: hypothetical protein IIV71_01495, partial [Bacteroidaceae bacterium]|nr:hypothetical protein [Bacteroidaceae bacterium]
MKMACCVHRGVTISFTPLSSKETWTRKAFSEFFIPQCPRHILSTEERFALFITFFFTYPKADLAKQH